MAAPVGSTRVPSWVPFFNPVARLLLAAGVPMGPNALAAVRGRAVGGATSGLRMGYLFGERTRRCRRCVSWPSCSRC